jgi:hypothetical protein
VSRPDVRPPGRETEEMMLKKGLLENGNEEGRGRGGLSGGRQVGGGEGWLY